MPGSISSPERAKRLKLISEEDFPLELVRTGGGNTEPEIDYERLINEKNEIIKKLGIILKH